jgi:murein DD-endopeptidase MepM/ murein hydrolase activator NlpD
VRVRVRVRALRLLVAALVLGVATAPGVGSLAWSILGGGASGVDPRGPMIERTGVRALDTAPTPTAAGPVHAGAAPVTAATAGSWVWPTGTRVVLRPFVRPAHDYGPGHRGLDVPAPEGTPASAPADGIVAFAGIVAGRPLVTIDHGGGLVSTLDSVVPEVAVGDVVVRGQRIGVVGTVSVAAGHCGPTACLHLGARLDGEYVDPLPFLSRPAWPVLLPAP